MMSHSRVIAVACLCVLLVGLFLFLPSSDAPPADQAPLDADTQSAAFASYREIRPDQLADALATVFHNETSAEMSYWQSKPSLTTTFAYPRRPKLSDSDREAVRRMKAGEFQANNLFPWKSLGVPPPWDQNPFGSNTYAFYLHALRWIGPLVNAWACGIDSESLDLTKRIMADWIRTNSIPPGASSYAWSDHATSYRMRIFCWFWELWRNTDINDPDFARLLLASIYQHGLYLADDAHYHATSNHALHMDGSLLAAAVTFPEFEDAGRWREIAERRMARYAETNFSPEGFNLEQSPSYHWYVLEHLGQVVEFLRSNRHPIPANLQSTVNDGVSVWPWLIRSDGAVPNVGDSAYKVSRHWPRRAQRLTGTVSPQPAPSTLPNPRTDASSFLLSFKAGYAIFTSYQVGQDAGETDTYVLFRCNSWPHSGHCHCDALSFELFGCGREWLVDSGKLNYEQSADRKYMISARAHNVVLVDGQDFTFHPIELVDSGRTSDCDFVTVRHDMPEARHDRRLAFYPPQMLRLTDELKATDGKNHIFAQLFHVAPDLHVEIESPTRVILRSKDGKQCTIEQFGDPGEWSVITGQREPYIQGWYSRVYNEMEPNPVLYYSTSNPVRNCKLITEISLCTASSHVTETGRHWGASERSGSPQEMN